MKAAIMTRIEKIRQGNVPKGYRRTSAGIMPEAWIKEDPLRAANIFKNHSNKNHDGNYEVLSATQDRGMIPRTEVNIDIKYAEENILGYKKVDVGDFVISLRSFQGGIEYSEREGLVSPAYTVLKSIRAINSGYYKAYFKTNDFISRLNAAVYGIRDGKQIGYADFGDITLHYPPISEQDKIAEILAHCDKLIDLKKQYIEEKRRQKKWLVQNLFDPDSGVRMPGFERSKWKKESFGKLFSFGASLSASRQNLGDKGICYLHYGDIHSNNEYFIDVTENEHMLPKLDVNRPVSKYLLNDGDVVFVDASEDYEGASKYVVIKNPNGIPFVSGLHTIPAHSKSNVLLNAFKRYCFQRHDVKIQIAFYASGMKVLGINKENLCKITLVYPSFSEQLAITSVLVTADHEINLLEQELNQLQAKKKALMQLLLTGIVRVN